MAATTMNQRFYRRLALPMLLSWIFTVAMLAGCQQESPKIENDRLHLTITGQPFRLEIAATAQQQYQGLSDRERIEPDGGMIFIHSRPQMLTFVMRRCKTPIDIIFLDGSGRVVSTHAMQVEPYDQPDSQLKRYSSQWPAQYAIELAGGTLEILRLIVGDRIPLPLDDLKKMAR